uniref:Dickkopf N-terminal cysteine-rich domain-containing protein n=1 Tax=Denticeps clupeoides TaxID=299321 RepID=A0AAY3ZXR7_9TELE
TCHLFFFFEQEGQYCRRDGQCVRGLSCMYGKCLRSIPDVDRDCGASMCCARHHGERVCKRRLAPGESCFVPDGGLAFSINQICPCSEGLLCLGRPIKIIWKTCMPTSGGISNKGCKAAAKTNTWRALELNNLSFLKKYVMLHKMCLGRSSHQKM